MPEANRRADRRIGGVRAVVVEDDHDMRELLVRLLELEGFEVAGAGSRDDAIEAVRRHRPSLVLLDTVLPGDDGLTVLGDVRKQTDVPVIFVSGRDDEAVRVLALRMGADDYVVKPFGSAELAARIEAVLRRSDRRSGRNALEHGELEIDSTTMEVRVGGHHVELTRREFELLRFLAQSPRQVFSREQLLRQVWNSSGEWQDEGTVTEHVRRLRAKLTAAGGRDWITTVRGGGYRFEPNPSA